MKQAGVRLLLKRAFDRTAAAAALVALSPVIAATAAAIRVTMGGPVVFRQQRPGMHGKPFHVFKFRTMRDAVGPDGRPLPDEERLTTVGRFIRSTSLDELPQLWNVVRGEISLVGPRPLLMQYLPRYTPEQARRHDVMPGITGWAQINGRNALSWDEKFALDIWYVDNWNLWLDARIVVRTLWTVVRREGVAREGFATMPEFMGSSERAE